MKSVKLNRLLIFAIALLMVMSVFTLIPFSFASGLNAFAADESDESDTEASALRLVLTCDVQELETLESDQVFTLTARIEGVANVEGGVYCVSVRITPLAAGDLEFVRFTPSRDREKGVYKSELMRTSQHKEGKYVSMEASCDTVHAITEDFEVGSFKFRLKKDPLAPTALKFSYRAMLTEFNLDFTSVPIEEDTFALSIKGISLWALIGIVAGCIAAIVVVIAVILIVDHKKKKGAKSVQVAAEGEVDNDSAVDAVDKAQEDSSMQENNNTEEIVYSDNSSPESDVSVAINDEIADNAELNVDEAPQKSDIPTDSNDFE